MDPDGLVTVPTVCRTVTYDGVATVAPGVVGAASANTQTRLNVC